MNLLRSVETEGNDNKRAFSNPVLASVRVIAIAAWTAIMLGAFLTHRAFLRGRERKIKASAPWTNRWLRGILRILGWRVHVHGPLPPPGALLTPNHTGYADVLSIGSAFPVHFVAKADVQSWPIVGFLFNSSDQMGVSRKRGRGVSTTVDEMTERLRVGDRICVFLEGTSTGGDRVLPFHPPLAEPAVEGGAPVVPVAIKYFSKNPAIDPAEDVAYWKDHVFATHLWRLTGLRGIEAQVTYGDPVSPEGHTRKTLAQEMRQTVMDLAGLPAADHRGGTYEIPFD